MRPLTIKEIQIVSLLEHHEEFEWCMGWVEHDQFPLDKWKDVMQSLEDLGIVKWLNCIEDEWCIKTLGVVNSEYVIAERELVNWTKLTGAPL